jgi:FkbM family methyltransferase
MFEAFKQYLRSKVPRRWILRASVLDGRAAFSQEGEDLILARIFETQPRGFYVDVGAHHPTRFSNTHYFYLRGWHGINIDATPGSMAAFRKSRPRDLNIETAIAEQQTKLSFHIFNDPALNTFDPALAKERDGVAHYRIVEIREIETRTLAQILREYASDQKQIDFMSIDVEGWDLAVLRSNDWKSFSPTYVLAEDFSTETIEESLHSPLAVFLGSVGYVLFAKTAHTSIFKRK